MWDGAGARKDMKRLRRIIFNGFSAVSLLLCVAAGVFWVRSYGVPERISYQRPGMSVRLNFDSGRFAPVLWMAYPQPPGWSPSPPLTGWFWWRDYATYYPAYVRWQHFGFGWGHKVAKAGGSPYASGYVLVLPMWGV